MSVPLEENCVRYCLFSSKITNDEASNEVYLNELLALISKHILSYQWNFVPFHLRIVPSNESHNQGISHFDENIEDEWFIVYLLFELSRQDESLVIQIQDTDGEFLLIEASNHLPRWVKPETVENRTFIHKNALHLIKRSDWPEKITTHDLDKAIKYVRDHHDQTVCETEVQDQILKKIEPFPEKIKALTHKTCINIPAKAAAIVEIKPNIISHAVRAFNSRDEHSIQACRLMKHFQPTNLIQKNVVLTKFNYAQLMGQRFAPDKKLNWPISQESEVKQRRSELGFKLCCGFEILVCEYEQNAFKLDGSKPTVSDHNPRWMVFVNSLKKSGYFDELDEKSHLYEQKMKQAKSYFDEFLSGDINRENEIYLDFDFLAGKAIHDILKDLEQSGDTETHQPNTQLSDEEDDRWLYELPDYFVEMEKAQQNELELGDAITQKLKQFLTGEAGHKGAVVPDKKKKLSERAMDMISDNLRNILTMNVSESEQETDSDMSDYDQNTDQEQELHAQSADRRKRQVPKIKLDAVSSAMADKSKQTREKSARRVTFDEINTSEDDEVAAEPEPKVDVNVPENKWILKELMKNMDCELSTTCLARSFEHKKKAPLVNPNQLEVFDDSDEEDSTRAHASGSIRDSEDLSEIDVELNATKNILESFKSQSGLAGPSSNILSSMGLHLPKDTDEN